MHLFVSVVWIALPFTAFTNPLPQEYIDPPSINSYATGTDIKPGDWLTSALPTNLDIDNSGEAEPELTKSNSENRNEEPLIIAEEPPPGCADSRYGQACCGRTQYSDLENKVVPKGHSYFNCGQSADTCPTGDSKRCCKELNSHTLPNFGLNTKPLHALLCLL